MIRKLQQGGKMKGLTFTPIKGTSGDIKGFISPDLTEKRPVLDKSLFGDMKGYGNDVDAVFNRINAASAKLNTMTSNEIHSVEGQRLIRMMTLTPADINKTVNAQKAGVDARKSADNNGGLTSLVRSNSGSVYVRDGNRVTEMTDQEIYKKSLIGKPVQLMTASGLLTARENETSLTNNSSVVSNAGETVGYGKVIGYIDKAIGNLKASTQTIIEDYKPPVDNKLLGKIWINTKSEEVESNNFNQIRSGVENILQNMPKAEMNALRNAALRDLIENRPLFYTGQTDLLDISDDNDLESMLQLQMRNKIILAFDGSKSSNDKDSKIQSYDFSFAKEGRERVKAGRASRKATKEAIPKFNKYQDIIAGRGEHAKLTYKIGDAEGTVISTRLNFGDATEAPRPLNTYSDLVKLGEVKQAQSSTGADLSKVVNQLVVEGAHDVHLANLPTINGKVAMKQLDLLRKYLAEVTTLEKASKSKTQASKDKITNGISKILAKKEYAILLNGITTKNYLVVNAMISDGTLDDDDLETYGERITDPMKIKAYEDAGQSSGETWGLAEKFSVDVYLPLRAGSGYSALDIHSKDTRAYDRTEAEQIKATDGFKPGKYFDIRNTDALRVAFGMDSKYSDPNSRANK